MANTYESSTDNLLGSDAEFQALIQKFEAALLASGFLEHTTDTGQIDPLTVVRPSVSTYAGYRIYRAKDALAATKPYYVKVEFGVGSVNDRILIRRTLATGSNGAGTLTGPTSAVGIIHGSSTAGSGAGMIYGGGGPSAAFVYMFDASQTSHTSLWVLGRLVDQDDMSVGDSILWDSWTAAGNSAWGTTYFWSDGATAWATPSNGLFNHGLNLDTPPNSGGDMNTTLLYQFLVYRNAKTWVFPMLTGRNSELPFTNPLSSQFSVNVWGGMHTFIPIPVQAITPTGQRMCFLWE